MNQTQLFNKFNEAIKWNSFLFLIGKINKTAISFFLFYKLSTSEFSIWANLYSLIFILTLWTDLGFSRSLPQYCLAFAKNSENKKSFITKVLGFKIIVSLIINILFLFLAPKFVQLLGLSPFSKTYFYLGGLLFFTESVKSSLRIIFHSYFWQKTFNLIESFALVAQTLTAIVIIQFTTSNLISWIFIIEILSGLAVVIISIAIIKDLEEDSNYQDNQNINENQLMKDFIKHSGVIWILNGINSLTERNILMPVLTFILGPSQANIFKVANDFALLFHRFVIKSIGTTGTSILAHIETKQVENHKQPDLLQEAFQKLNKQIILLTLPLLGIILSFYIQINFPSNFLQTFKITAIYNYPLIQICLLLAALYLIQIIFMAYERLLEVKRDYKELFISFIPHIFIIFLFIVGISAREYTSSIFSLATILLLIHAIRLSGALIKIYFSWMKYKIQTSSKFLFKSILTTLLIITILNLLIYLL